MGTLGPALFAMQQQMPQQQQQPDQTAVPTNDPFAQSTMQTMQAGRESYTKGEADKAQLAQQLAQIRAQQAGTAPLSGGDPNNPQYLHVPQYGYDPKFQKMDSIKHVLGDIGKGALLGLAATRPGQAVQAAKYGPGVSRYETESKGLEDRAKELQAQMGTTVQGQTAAGGMATRPYGALARYEVGKLSDATRRVHDAWNQKVQEGLMQIKKDYDDKVIDAKTAQTKADILIGQGHDNALRDAASIHGGTEEATTQSRLLEDQWKQDEFGWKDAVRGWFGGQAPPIDRPARVNPTPPKPPARAAKGGSPPAGATHIGTGKDGQDHYIDAQGKDLGLVNATRH